MRRKLSPKLIEQVKSSGPKRTDVWDTVLQCFGLRISPTGRKAWFVIVRLNGRQKRVTLGTYPAISLAEARTEARRIIRDAQLGLLSDSRRSPALKLGETVPLFIELYAKPKNRGWKESERLLGKFQSLSPNRLCSWRAVTLCAFWTKSSPPGLELPLQPVAANQETSNLAEVVSSKDVPLKIVPQPPEHSARPAKNRKNRTEREGEFDPKRTRPDKSGSADRTLS